MGLFENLVNEGNLPHKKRIVLKYGKLKYCEFQSDVQRHAQIEKCTPGLDFLFMSDAFSGVEGFESCASGRKDCRHGVGVLSPHSVTLVEFIGTLPGYLS